MLAALLGWSAFYTARRARMGAPFEPPARLGVGATILFAIASTISDIPTAIPYFAAASSIAAQQQSMLHDLAYLTLYNLIYCAPLVALFLARLLLAERRSARLFGSLKAAIDWTFAALLPSLLALAAIALATYGAYSLWAG